MKWKLPNFSKIVKCKYGDIEIQEFFNSLRTSPPIVKISIQRFCTCKDLPLQTLNVN